MKTKAQLIAELAERSGLTRSECARAYNALVALVGAHAAEGVNLPGLCQFRMADRAARYVRDPRSGQRFLIKAHKALTVKVSRATRARLTPLPPDCRVPAPEAAPVVEWVTFACRACGATLEASADMRGRQALCPACSAGVTVPTATMPTPAITPTPPAPPAPAPAAGTPDLRSTTMRIELPALPETHGPRPRRFVVPRHRGP